MNRVGRSVHFAYCICHVRQVWASQCNFENWESSNCEPNGQRCSVVVCAETLNTREIEVKLINDSSTLSCFLASVSIWLFSIFFSFIFVYLFAVFILSNVYSIRQKHHFQFCQNNFLYELVLTHTCICSFFHFRPCSPIRLTKWNFALFEQRNFRQRVEWSQNHDGIGTTGRFQPAKGGDED